MEGRCLCGAVTLRVSESDRHAGACHCRMCQRWTGGAFVAFFAPADAVAIEGPVVRHASSSFGERAFCGTCGSHVWFRGTGDPEARYELTPGLFDDAAFFPLRSEIYADRAMASVPFAGDHTRETRAEYEAGHRFVPGGA